MIVRFLKHEDFRDNFKVTTDVDADTLKKVIYNAQEINIHGLIGTDLYKKNTFFS